MIIFVSINNVPPRNSGVLTLIPLTIDRLEAVVRPLRHRLTITPRSSAYMVAASWIPTVVLFLFDAIAYGLGFLEVGLRLKSLILSAPKLEEPDLEEMLPSNK